MSAPIEPHLFAIFGATGDLARRKLIPAYYRLAFKHQLEAFQLLGVGRNELQQGEFRDLIRQALHESEVPRGKLDEWCDRCVHYVRSEGDFGNLASAVRDLEEAKRLSGDRVFYLALPPNVFGSAIRHLGEAGLGDGDGNTTLVIEKPFGHSLESAKELNALLHRYFSEEQIYRIDHYLGKETVQNLLVFRFANALFESTWNRDRIEKVQITVAESIGVGSRASYYDDVGAIRDMIQNHLTQVMTLVAMEPPAAFVAETIRNEKVKVLRSIREIKPFEVVLGQYAAGKVEGTSVAAYLDEPDVRAGSTTETSVAMQVNIDNWRWQGVPFLLRTGKRFPRRLTQVVVTYRRPPVLLFDQRRGAGQTHSNRLVITLQPNEGFELLFDVKRPVEPLELETLPLTFEYGETFGDLPDAYETLILDVLTGDQTLFVRSDEVEESWRLYDPIIENPPPVHPYPAGTWGPRETYQQLGPQGATWLVR